MRKAAMFLALALLGLGSEPSTYAQACRLSVLVNGSALPTYDHGGTTYLEAVKGREYEIRVTNPTGMRVAVALSVDGLNTIDARHTDPRSARKWVLEPYQSIVISGWQTNAHQARRFYFTTEDRSYGAWLGRKENLGIISAAFFRERAVPAAVSEPARSPQGRPQADSAGSSRPAARERENRADAKAGAADYAATGMGERMRHDVQWVSMDLEDRPFATVDLRYEFRPVLVRLGVLPPGIAEDPLARRQRAEGFRNGGFCPEPR